MSLGDILLETQRINLLILNDPKRGVGCERHAPAALPSGNKIIFQFTGDWIAQG